MRVSKRYGSEFFRWVVVVVLAMGATTSMAGPREQAKRIHDRLVGVPPAADVLDSMTAKVAGGDAVGAAMEAMDEPEFYNSTVREFATPWSNRDQSVYNDLNDATATVVGMIRDDLPFDRLLYDDIVYVGSAGASNVAYSQTDNAHYVDLQSRRVDLSDPNNLEQRTQSGLPRLTPRGGSDRRHPDHAGLRGGLSGRRNQPSCGSLRHAQLHVPGHGGHA